jgi:hypothetical protein
VGGFRGDQGDRNRLANRADPIAIDKQKSNNVLLNSHFNFAPTSKIFAQTRVYYVDAVYDNRNQDRLTIDDIRDNQVGVRDGVSAPGRLEYLSGNGA